MTWLAAIFALWPGRLPAADTSATNFPYQGVTYIVRTNTAYGDGVSAAGVPGILRIDRSFRFLHVPPDADSADEKDRKQPVQGHSRG